MNDEIKHRVIEQYINEDGKLVLVTEDGRTCVSPTEPVHRARWKALAIWAAVFTVITFFSLYQLQTYANENRGRAKEGQQAHDSICALKDNLRQRVRGATKFLHDNPNGIPGIPPATIRASNARDRNTLVSLREVSCDD